MAVVLAAMCITFLIVYIRMKSIQAQLDKLNTRTYECVSEMLFRLEQGNRRELERRVDAIQEHFQLITVQQQQKTMVVKKGNAP